MPEFTAKDVQALRRATGAGMLDAKKALEETGGDMDEATKWLRVKGLGSADKRSGREASQGAVAVGKDGNAAAIVELKSRDRLRGQVRRLRQSGRRAGPPGGIQGRGRPVRAPGRDRPAADHAAGEHLDR